MNNEIKKEVTESVVKFDRKKESIIKAKCATCDSNLYVMIPWYVKECIDSAYKGWSKGVYDSQIIKIYNALPQFYKDILRLRVKGYSMTGIGRDLCKGKKDQMGIQKEIDRIFNLFIGATSGQVYLDTKVTDVPGDTELSKFMIPADYINLLKNRGIVTVADVREYIKTAGDLKATDIIMPTAKSIVKVLNSIGFMIKYDSQPTPAGGYIITGSIINKIWEPAVSRTNTFIKVDTPEEVDMVLGYALQKEFRLTAPTPKEWFKKVLDCKARRTLSWIPYGEQIVPYDWSGMKCNCEVQDPSLITCGSKFRFGKGGSCYVAHQDGNVYKRILQYTIEVRNVSLYELKKGKTLRALTLDDLKMNFMKEEL